jgi:glyoxylase-like metal-dependent hydrolase (beta-lactamase superfamily II)
VRFVINTHWHDDHVIGNGVYADAFPGVAFVGHASTRARILDTVAPSLDRNRTAYAEALADLERLLEKGVGADGKPMTPQARTANDRLAQLYRGFLAEMPRMRIVAPDVIVDDELTIVRGEREIRVLFLGRGNTAGDLVVHMPKEGIVATGDLLVQPVPFAFGSYPSDWSGTLARLEVLQPRVMMPGHGPVLRDMTFLTAVREALSALSAQIRDAVAKGMTLEQARAALDLKSYEARMPGGNFMGMFVIPASERAYLQAKGEIK